jgi:hypothetical protein
MQAEAGVKSESKHWIRRLRPAGPLGVAVVLSTMLIILAAEPAIAWILLPSVLLGGVFAFTMHRLTHNPTSVEPQRAEIQIAKIPVAGVMGLVFTVGMMAVFFAALPEVRLFLLLSLPLGALLGVALYLWHKRHPLS